MSVILAEVVEVTDTCTRYAEAFGRMMMKAGQHVVAVSRGRAHVDTFSLARHGLT